MLSGSIDLVDGWLSHLSTEDLEQLISDLKLSEQQHDELVALSSIYSDTLRIRIHPATNVPILQIPIFVTLHGAYIHFTIKMIPDYPNVVPEFNLHGTCIMKESLLEMCEVISKQAQDLLHSEMIYQLTCKVEEMVQAIPPAAISDHFVCCLKCNIRLLNKRQAKHPQPAAKKTSNGSGGGGDVVYECMICHSTTETIFLEDYQRNLTGESCHFCFCEENPLLRLPCGELGCTSCFQSFASLEIGSKRLKYDAGTEHFSVCCPNHPDTFIKDINVFKLLDPQSFTRFHLFAFELAVISIHHGVICPLPKCKNAPFIPDTPCALLHCPHCGGFFCKQCQNVPVECHCPTIGEDTKLIIYSVLASSEDSKKQFKPYELVFTIH